MDGTYLLYLMARKPRRLLVLCCIAVICSSVYILDKFILNISPTSRHKATEDCVDEMMRIFPSDPYQVVDKEKIINNSLPLWIETAHGNRLFLHNPHQVENEDKLINKSLSVYAWNKSGNKIYIGDLPDGIFYDNAPDPTQGGIWPEPTIVLNYTQVYTVNAEQLVFTLLSDVKEESCDVLSAAINRYTEEVRKLTEYAEKVKCKNLRKYETENKLESIADGTLNRVDLMLSQPCDNGYPRKYMDESYEIEVHQTFAVIRANESWGLVRGMESFYQLLYISKLDSNVYINSTKIVDRPVHPHRGLMIDTARHFIPVEIIKLNMEAMAQNKMNVLHWHIIDDQSFPFQSKAFPQFWQKGAYSLDKIYSYEDILEIIEFARLRGIRVIPEIDTPGHTLSWAKTAGIHMYCGNNSNGMLDITNPKALQILRVLFQEIRELFKDNSIHIGGDEGASKCFYLNMKIRPLLDNHTKEELYRTYITGLVDMLHDIDPEWHIIAWDEVISRYKAELQLDPKKSTIQVWTGMPAALQSDDYDFNVITSHCWYLDHLTESWKTMYDCALQPTNTVIDIRPIKYEGGEACMWTERVDENNILQTIWPRAIATAERLWTFGTQTHEKGTVEQRFYEQTCRMIRRGIPVAPVSGAGNCE